MSDVTLTLEVITQNLEAIKEVEKEVLSLADTMPKLADGFTEGNESLGDFMAKFDKAVDILKGGNKEIKLTSKQIEKALDFSKGAASLRELAEAAKDPQKALKELGFVTKEAAKKQKELDKANKSNIGSLKQLAKGVLGVATAYAAGRAVVRFISQSVEVAREAGVEAAALDQLESSWQKLKRLSGEIIINVTAGPVEDVVETIDKTNAAIELLKLNAKQLAAAGIIRTAAITQEQIDLSPTGRSEAISSFSAYADAVTLVGLSSVEAEEMVSAYFQAIADGAAAAQEGIDANSQFADKLLQTAAQGDGVTSLADAIKRRTIIPDISGQIEKELAESARAFDAFFAEIAEGFTGEAEAILIGLEFEDLGGDEIITMMDRIKVAFEAGKISREEFRELMGFVFAAEEATKVAQGIQTALEAGIKIDELLDLPPGEGAKLVEAWLAGGVDIGKLLGEALEIPELTDDMQRLIDKLDAADKEIVTNIDKTTITEADTEAGKLLEILEEIDGSTFKAVVEIELRIRESDSSSGPGKEPEKGLAEGGMFRVAGTGGIDSTQVSFMGTPGETILAIPPGNTTNNTNTFGDVFPQSLDLGAMADAEEDEFLLG